MTRNPNTSPVPPMPAQAGQNPAARRLNVPALVITALLFVVGILLVLKIASLGYTIYASASNLAKVERAVAEKQQAVQAQKKQIALMTSAEGAEAAGRSKGMVKPSEVAVNIDLPANARRAENAAAAATPVATRLSLLVPALGGLALLLLVGAAVLRRRALRAQRRAGTLTPRLELRRKHAHAAQK